MKNQWFRAPFSRRLIDQRSGGSPAATTWKIATTAIRDVRSSPGNRPTSIGRFEKSPQSHGLKTRHGPGSAASVQCSPRSTLYSNCNPCIMDRRTPGGSCPETSPPVRGNKSIDARCVNWRIDHRSRDNAEVKNQAVIKVIPQGQRRFRTLGASGCKSWSGLHKQKTNGL